MAGNVLVGGIIGVGVDAASGAALDLTPNPVVVTLQPLGEQPKSADDELRSAWKLMRIRHGR